MFWGEVATTERDGWVIRRKIWQEMLYRRWVCVNLGPLRSRCQDEISKDLVKKKVPEWNEVGSDPEKVDRVIRLRLKPEKERKLHRGALDCCTV